MPLNVEKLKSSRMFQHVVRQIEDAVVSGELLPGDVLPSENKLAAMFDTSRGTVREALRVLEERGLVDVRVGVSGGAIVREPDMDGIGERLDFLVRVGCVDYDHMDEFRRNVEAVVASLAASRITPGGVDRLNEALQQARDALQRSDAGEFLRGDVAVHLRIAEIAGNPLFLAVLRMVHENILGAFPQFRLRGISVLERNCRDLERLVEAVSSGDVERAAHLAREHVRTFNTTMKAQHRLRKAQRSDP